jgi:hypothetical protein
VDQLRNWHDYFEREQMLILKSEDFYSRTPRRSDTPWPSSACRSGSRPLLDEGT